MCLKPTNKNWDLSGLLSWVDTSNIRTRIFYEKNAHKNLHLLVKCIVNASKSLNTHKPVIQNHVRYTKTCEGDFQLLSICQLLKIPPDKMSIFEVLLERLTYKVIVNNSLFSKWIAVADHISFTYGFKQPTYSSCQFKLAKILLWINVLASKCSVFSNANVMWLCHCLITCIPLFRLLCPRPWRLTPSISRAQSPRRQRRTLLHHPFIANPSWPRCSTRRRRELPSVSLLLSPLPWSLLPAVIPHSLPSCPWPDRHRQLAPVQWPLWARYIRNRLSPKVLLFATHQPWQLLRRFLLYKSFKRVNLVRCARWLRPHSHRHRCSHRRRNFPSHLLPGRPGIPPLHHNHRCRPFSNSLS